MNSFFQDVQHNFYQSFVERDRWALYLDGLKISFIVMLGALALGIILAGILVFSLPL